MLLNFSQHYLQNLCADMMSAMMRAAPHDLDLSRPVPSLYECLSSGYMISTFLDMYPHISRVESITPEKMQARHLVVLAMAHVLDQEAAICHDDLWDDADSDRKNDWDYDDFFTEDGVPLPPENYPTGDED
jgi:hypothetical protein